MAGNAQIGSLRVSLGLDSAQFTSGLKRASSTLGKFGVQVTLGLETITNVIGRVVGAFPRAIKAAIDTADEMRKLGQSVGVPVDELTRLNHAADLSGVSTESLGTALKKLSQNMLTVAQGAGGTAKLAFDALGISVKNSDGTLKSSSEVMSEVADSFSRMRDGAVKTGLAIQIFGKAGASLIPLLDAGAAGIQAMKDEADQLGIVISAKTAMAAEGFNDNLTRLHRVFDGVVTTLASAMLPMLEDLSQALIDAAKDSGSMQAFAEGLVEIFKGLVTVGIVVVETFKAIGGGLSNMMLAVQIAQTGFQNWGLALEVLNRSFSDIGESASNAIDLVKQLWVETGSVGDIGRPVNFSEVLAFRNDNGSPPVDPTIPIKDMKDQIEITIPRITEMQQAFLDLGTTVESSLSGIMSGLVKDVIKGGDAFGGLIDKVGQLGEKLIDMAASQAIQGLFGSIMGIFGGGMGMGSGAIGRGVFGGTGGFFPAFPGFEGGGFTGAGSRVGGIDGRGGFLATLHPNETVIDHTRGGGGGGGLTVNVDARGAQVGVAEQLDQWARFQLPSIIRRHANSTMPENG